MLPFFQSNCIFVFAFLSLLIRSDVCCAETLIFFDENGGGENPRGLYNFDTETGLSSLRAEVPGNERFFAMAVRPSDQTVFAITLDEKLFTININSGMPTLVGDMKADVQLANSTHLAIHPITEQAFLVDFRRLYELDLVTANASFVSRVVDLSAVAFSPDGDLTGLFFPRGAMHSVDTNTGSATLIGGPNQAGLKTDGTYTNSGRRFAVSFAGQIVETDPTLGHGIVVAGTGMGNGLLALIEAPESQTSLELVSAIGNWKYLDDGSNQGTAWISAEFNDGTWKEGFAEFGYGDESLAAGLRPEPTLIDFGQNRNDKFVTTYFRHAFEVTDKDKISALSLGLVRDDGAAVYLNGEEIVRDNLPAQAAFNEFALQEIEGNDEWTFSTYSIDPSLLIEGENLLAVEIHLASASSDDLSFAAKLTATVVPEPNCTVILWGILMMAGRVRRL